MKCTFESTERETLGYLRLLDRVLSIVEEAVRRDLVLSSSAPPHAEAPAPVPEVAPAKETPPAPEKSERDKKQIEHGRVMFHDLVNKWAVNFGVEGAEQPDRLELLRSVATGYDATAVLHYVSTLGGLTHAVDACLGPEARKYPLTPAAEEATREWVRLVSANIMQVSSLFFTDLCAMYEYRDIYRED